MIKAGINLAQSINAKDYPRRVNEHAAEKWLRLANETPQNFNFSQADDAIINTELFVTKEEILECKQWLASREIDSVKPIICIQAGNKKTTRSGKINRNSNTKYWPEQNWANVINAINEHLPTAQVLLCGVPAEHAISLDIKTLCSNQQKIHCVSDDLPLRRLLALLSTAHSCISVDTGPAHAAAALNCPLTVLFGKTDARSCRPISSQSRVIIVAGRDHNIELLDSPTSWGNAHSMSLITPDAVIEGWTKSIDIHTIQV